MKIAKADKNDLESAARLLGILTDVSCGYYPRRIGVSPEDASVFFDPDNKEHLRAFYEQIMACFNAAPGGMHRVVMGFQLIVSSNLVDPNKNYLDYHPSIKAALSAAKSKVPVPG